VVLSVRSFRRVAAGFAAQFGRRAAISVIAAVVATLVALFFITNEQPQHAAFALLKERPHSDGERQQLLNREAQIRAGLLNAYLSPFRYLSAVSENDHIDHMYRDVFNLTGTLPARLQAVQDQLFRPFLFQGQSMTGDQAKAEELYEHF